MIAVTALILLAEAAVTCAPPGIGRLQGGAMLVRPVGTFEAVPFERLGPTTSVRKSPIDIQQTGAPTPAPKPEGNPPADQCEAVDFPIA